MWAAHDGWTETVKVLLGAKADPALKAADGFTARDMAVARGHLDAAELLK